MAASMFKPASVALAAALLTSLAAASHAAEPTPLRPGEKWLECYVGQGGFATPGDLLLAVARALDAGDGAALAKLGYDRCAYFRAATLHGWQSAEGNNNALAAPDLAQQLADLGARLKIEGVRLAEQPRAEVQERIEQPALRVIAADSPLLLTFAADKLDERWYLTGVPWLDGAGAPVVAKAKALFGELGGALEKHNKRPDAARKTLDGWWKRHGAELVLVTRAARTLREDAAKNEYETARADFVARLGDLMRDAGIAESLALVLPAFELRVGIFECDRYLADFMRCAAAMPSESGAAIRDALKQAADAWRQAAATEAGRNALANACTMASEVMRSSVASMCPGVLDGPRP